MYSKSTESVLKWFKELSKIPRKSKNEAGVRSWLEDVSKRNGWKTKSDKVGNLCIQVPATKCQESRPVLVLQGHMDMVCEKTPDSNHDFSKDGIEVITDGDWLRANKTTLGSDNGIAIALTMAMCTDPSIEHPELELLFTIDEETGLTGASNLEPGFIKGKVLLNIDSEDEGVFTVGCAGGRNADICLPVECLEIPKSHEVFQLKVSGLMGGHSGVNIKDQRGNAIKTIFRALTVLNNDVGLNLIDVIGGSAHNAIPRDVTAYFAAPIGKKETLVQSLNTISENLKKELSSIDPKLKIEFVQNQSESKKMFSVKDTLKTIDFVNSMPHGVSSMATGIEGLVETSNNLAKVWCGSEGIKFISSQRSCVMSKLDEICYRIESLVRLAGGTCVFNGGYPPWEPNWQSGLLAKCKAVYKSEFAKEPVVEVIHAGLECGIIGAKYSGMDMISFGPTIKNPHTPQETLHIPDIDMIWKLMVKLFKEL